MIASKMPAFFGSLLVIALGLMIFVQLSVNIAVAVNLIPVTGQPLPLISYGGTSMLVTYIQLGIILNVSSRIQVYDEGRNRKKTKYYRNKRYRLKANKMDKKLKVIMSGGGTGGHIFPAIAIAQEIAKKISRCSVFVHRCFGKNGNGKSSASRIPIEGLNIAGFHRGNLLKTLSLPFKILSSFAKAKKLITGIQT